MTNRPRGRHIVRSYRRPVFWGRSPNDSAATALAANTAVLDSSAIPLVEGETIVRVRGQIIVGTDQVAAAEEWAGAVGMCVVTDQALAVGIGSIPTPYSDQDSDLFFMHQFFGGRLMAAADDQIMTRFEFDSKAMRKLPSGSSLAVVVETANAGGILYWLQYAVLFKVN